MNESIIIIDFGSQVTKLIARRIREFGVFSEIISHKKIKNKDINEKIKGIILSGGPLNVYDIKKYSFDKNIIENEIKKAKAAFKKYKWPVVDVTRKSVEETAASVIKIYEIKSKKNA